MEAFSSLVVALVFLSGVSAGALFTAFQRHVARDRIQAEFESRLAAIVEARELSTGPSSRPFVPPTTKASEDRASEEPPNEEETVWIAHRVESPKPENARL